VHSPFGSGELNEESSDDGEEEQKEMLSGMNNNDSIKVASNSSN